MGREQVEKRNQWGGLDKPNYDPVARLVELAATYRRYPGAAPQGTGETGLLPNDAQGYSRMLNDRTEYMKLKDYFSKNPKGVDVRFGGTRPPLQPPQPSTAGVGQMAIAGLQRAKGPKPRVADNEVDSATLAKRYPSY